MDTKISKRIAELRIERQLNQRELAEQLGVSNGAIGMWETGKRQPDLDMIIKLASFFSVSIDYLLGYSDQRSFYTDQEEAEFLELFRKLDTDNRDIIRGDMKKYIKEQNFEFLSGGSFRDVK